LTLSDNSFFFATPYQAPPNHGSEEYEFSDNPFCAIVVNLGLFLNRRVDLPQGEPYYDPLERVSTSAPVTAEQKSETFHPQVN
jgi:hypothetical protein